MTTKTSKYNGVYYSTPSSRWIVWLQLHDRYPSFFEERDAGIYAEYHYRKKYINRQTNNFPELNDDELAIEYENTMQKLSVEQAEVRSSSKQGLKKIKSTTSRFVGVHFKDASRWCAKIQYRGKSIYIASFSVNMYHDAEIRAALAYDEKALELYGENARLNFPIHG